MSLGYIFTIWPSWCKSLPVTKRGNYGNFSSDSSFLHPPLFPSPSLTTAINFPSWFCYNGSSDLKWNCFVLSFWHLIGLLCLAVWLTWVWKSSQSVQWERMAKKRKDGDIQEWNWTCYSCSGMLFVSDHIIRADCNCAMPEILSLIWTFHSTTEISWAGMDLGMSFSLLTARSKGPLEVSLVKCVPMDLKKPHFGCKICLLTFCRA